MGSRLTSWPRVVRMPTSPFKAQLQHSVGYTLRDASCAKTVGAMSYLRRILASVA